jgi:hypothetical protein
MISRGAALAIGMVLGGALVWSVWRSSHPRACAPEARADALLGGGLPICLGQSPAQFAQYGARVRRDDSTEDRFFTALDLRFWYGVSGGVNVLFGHVGRTVNAACVESSGSYPRSVDSMAAFRRSLSRGDWMRADSVHRGITVTTWWQAGGPQQTVSSSGVFCVRAHPVTP